MNIAPLFKICVVASFLFVSHSCIKEEIDGDCTGNINPQNRNVTFSSEEDSTIVTTKRDFWWIDGVNNENEYLYSISENRDTVVGEWFIITKTSNNSLKIKVSKNISTEKRHLQIGLQAGNCFDHVAVTQE